MIAREIAQKHKKLIETNNILRNARSCQKVTEQLVENLIRPLQLVENLIRPFRPFKLRELPANRSYKQIKIIRMWTVYSPGVVRQNNDRLSKKWSLSPFYLLSWITCITHCCLQIIYPRFCLLTAPWFLHLLAEAPVPRNPRSRGTFS